MSDPSGLCTMNPISLSFWDQGNCIQEGGLWTAHQVSAHSTAIDIVTGGFCTIAPGEACAAVGLGAAGVEVLSNDLLAIQDPASAAACRDSSLWDLGEVGMSTLASGLSGSEINGVDLDEVLPRNLFRFMNGLGATVSTMMNAASSSESSPCGCGA